MNHLSPPIPNLRAGLPEIVSILEARLPYGAVQVSSRRGLHIQVDDNEEQVVERAPETGIVLTAFDGATLHEHALGGLDFSAARAATHSLAGRLQANGSLEIDPGLARKLDFITPMQIDPASLTIDEKLARLHDLHDRLRGMDARIVNVQVAYIERSELSVFANRQADLGQTLTRLVIYLNVFVSDGQNLRYDYLSKSGVGGWEHLEFSDEELRGLVQSAVALLTAERIEPGEYTIITAPGVSGTLCHESFGHGVETDMFLKERAKAFQYLERKVGSPLVNILDDPTVPGAFGFYAFDDEGWLASPTQIVKDGIFRQGISDQYSAAVLGLPRTANGRRQDFRRKPYARMSNTFFAAGETPVEDLFAQVEHGYYLEKWSSGMEDPQGWGIQVTCHYGHEIRNGKVTDRVVAPVGISGYVPDVLESISAVGADFLLDGGGCGKGHKEWMSVASGGPHLLMKARLG